jgi:hypothetical protein
MSASDAGHLVFDQVFRRAVKGQSSARDMLLSGFYGITDYNSLNMTIIL